MVEFLLSKGAYVDALSNRGSTPMHWAVFKGHKDVAELLGQHGGHDIGSNLSARDWSLP
jgi:ankyrin repeat protein